MLTPRDLREPSPRELLVRRMLDRGASLAEAMARSRIEGASTSVAYLCQNNPFAATAGAKTALLIAAPAGHGLAMVEFAISFDGVTATAVPALVELTSSTQATAGTAGGSPVAALQTRGRATGGSAPTVSHNYTAEPTVLSGGRQWYVSPNGGVLVMQFPLGRERECDSSAGTTKALGVRVNVTANVNVLTYAEVEAVG